MKKVILVNAVFFSKDDSWHIGQFILRDILKKEYDVEVINFDYLCKTGIINYSNDMKENIRLMGDYLLEKKPEAVGFYTICNAYVTSLKLAEYIKLNCPECFVFLGGPQASVTYHESLEVFPFIDAICVGESELMIKEFINAAIEQDCDFENVNGVAYKKNEGIFYRPNERMLSAEELHFYMIKDFSPFMLNKGDRFNIEGGRGCPYSCSFCTTNSFWGNKYRLKKIDDIIDEIMFMNQKYGISDFAIQHDMFTANRKKIAEFCRKVVDLNKNIDWVCSSRIDVLTYELIDIMDNAKCSAIYIGLETGSPRMQKKIHKRLDLSDAIEKLLYIKANTAIKTTVSFVYCFPDENIRDFKYTIDIIEKLYLEGITGVQLHRFMPLPGTEEMQKVKERLYYDKDVSELTLTNLNNSVVEEYIKKYPYIFSQYYTFDSEVKDRYQYFDIMVGMMEGLSEFYYHSFEFLMKMWGIEQLYFRMKRILKEVRNRELKMSINDNYNNGAEKRILFWSKLLNSFFDNIKLDSNEMYIFDEIKKYEKYKSVFFVEKRKISEVLKFKINLHKWFENEQIVYEDYYIKYKWDNGTVYTIQMKLKEALD